MQPNLESIQEMQVTVNNYSAESASDAGLNVNVLTRGGTKPISRVGRLVSPERQVSIADDLPAQSEPGHREDSLAIAP